MSGRRGFTLLEVLVVLVILALAAGLASVAWDGDERGGAERQARLFAGALEHAALRAAIRAETLGVSADGTGWRFWRRAQGRSAWTPITDDDVLRPKALPSGLTLRAVAYAGAPLAADAIVPLRATGRNEPFEFALSGDRTRIVLAADPLNRIALTVTADASER